jgi:hypothetical protein
MDFLINLLSDPKILSVLSLPTICIAGLSFALWKLFQKYDSLQEQRLKEWSDMVNDYNKLCNDITNTLDLIIKLSGKNNGNGGSK